MLCILTRSISKNTTTVLQKLLFNYSKSERTQISQIQSRSHAHFRMEVVEVGNLWLMVTRFLSSRTSVC